MRIINKKAGKFDVGKSVIVKKPYHSGTIILDVGRRGTITGSSIFNLPDMGLFNIRVLDINFSGDIVSLAEQIAHEFMDAAS